MGTFSADITRFCGNTKEGISRAVRKLVLDLHSNIVRRSPVDTGRFRANNQVSLNSIPADAVLAFEKNGNGTVSVGEAVMIRFSIGDTIFLYNNVEYALALEYGHSTQAPEGVYRLSAMELIAKIGGSYA
jgi:hypothetical protein